MIILVKKNAGKEEVKHLLNLIESQYANPIYIEKENAISVLNENQKVEISPKILNSMPCVEKIICYNQKSLMI